tara:strand:+ start:1026 stop:1439 length:414 start_codon:yes stop_codon:yes gene_type:complete
MSILNDKIDKVIENISTYFENQSKINNHFNLKFEDLEKRLQYNENQINRPFLLNETNRFNNKRTRNNRGILSRFKRNTRRTPVLDTEETIVPDADVGGKKRRRRRKNKKTHKRRKSKKSRKSRKSRKSKKTRRRRKK